MLNLVFSVAPLLLRSRLCLKASREGDLLHCQLSPVPHVPQILLTPQNVAINQGINLRVALAALIVVEVVRSRFILFVSHQTSLKTIQVTLTDSQTDRHTS